MRIHGMTLVKNEADVLGETLHAAIEWCDRIYVLDNGSTDGTWELVNELAVSQPAVVPFKQDPREFNDALRGEIFQSFRGTAEPGDWWCVLDADEIYIDNPRIFLRNVTGPYGEVWSSSVQYYFTDEDLASYESDPKAFVGLLVQERLRYYANNWSESRFFRHHRGLVWRQDASGRPLGSRPVGLGAVYPRRIRLKHYQYRSPEQIQQRLDARAHNAGFPHERRAGWGAELRAEVAATAPRMESRAGSWEERVVPAAGLHFDSGDGRYVADEQALPPLPANRFRSREVWHRVMAARWRLAARLRSRLR